MEISILHLSDFHFKETNNSFFQKIDKLILSIFNKLHTSNELKKLYIKKFFMNVLNPKVSIFFLVFLPQFVTPSNGNILSKKLLEKPNIVIYMNILIFFVLDGLAVKLALSSR